ncbi:cadherin-like domain-containing protein [Flavobacterium sp. UW10123]|uniref:Ig-like domain-containing protein n=1 Tax=Flavobacterium sp. UW10123 TaxID=3230800 RepID=UPI0033910F3C
MKKTLLLFLLLPFFGFAQNVDLIKWNATIPNDENKPTVNPNVALSYLTSSEVQVKYNNGWEPEPFFICSGWPTGQQNEGEYDPAKYVEFKVTPISGKKLDLTTFNLTFKSQGGGSTEKFTILYTKDEKFQKDIKVLVPERTSVDSWVSINPSFSEEINPVLPGQTVYVRLYVYNSNNAFHIKIGKPDSNPQTATTITGSVSDFDPNKILAINDYVKAIKNTTLNISPLNNDVKKENVASVTISSPPPASQGTATVNPDNTITFNPAANFTGVSTFKYTIKDASNLTSEAKIQATVGEETPESLVIWYGRNASNRVEATVLSPYVTSGNIGNKNVSINHNINEDAKNPFFQTAGWPSGVASDTKYIEFTITADNSHRVNLTALNFMFRNQGGNGQKFKIEYTNDPTFTTNRKTLLAETSTTGSWKSISAPFSSDLNYLLPGKTMYIRLYVYNSNEEFQFRTKINITGNIKDPNVFAAYSDFATTPSNKSINISILANDVVGSTPVQNIEVTQPTTGGTVVKNGITDVTFIPTPGFVGMSNFTYTISNGTLYSSATVSVDVTPAPCAPAEDPTVFENDKWIGYVYKYPKDNPVPTIGYNDTPNTAIATYVGTVTENKNFDRDVDSGAITGVTSNFPCEVAPSDYFLVRYRMRTKVTETGLYNFLIGGDDAIRLYIDGEIVLERWSGGSYAVKSSLYKLEADRNYDFVIEYYELAANARASFSFGLTKGDPTEFGDKVWNVYGYNGNDITLTTAGYAGYYIDTNPNANSTAYWPTTKSPAAAINWQGSTMLNDYFTVVSKRKGFACGQYQIQVANYDDDLQIFVDGTEVFYEKGNTDTAVLVKKGQIFSLNSKTKVEIRLKENGGGAKSSVIFINIPNNGTGDGTGSTLEINENTELNSDLTVCSCTINDGATLTVKKDVTLTIDEDINVLGKGKLLILDGGALLQTSTSKDMFTGSDKSFEIQRITKVRRMDLTYWSTPVNNKDFAMKTLSPETLFDKYFYFTSDFKWATNLYGVMIMEPTKGYSIRGPQYFDTQIASDFTGKFYGTPNNGDFPIATTADKHHLIGNPYPSAIDGRKFIRDNGDVGPLYFWTHVSLPKKENGSNTYRYSSPDYAILTLFGSTKATTGGEAPSGYIGVGQGFIVKPKVTSLVFRNDQRVKAQNTQFFKTTAKQDEGEVNRLWLNLSNDEDAFKQLLIGYAEGATNSFDYNYDATTLSSNSYVDFYTINETKRLSIQARALPFDNTEIIPLGYKAVAESQLTISIDHADGFFNTQAVYLEDKITGIITDLRASNYTFTTTIGTFPDRFVLRYTNKTLGTGDFENTADGVLVAVKSKVIHVTSGTENIKEVKIYTIGGQSLYNNAKIEEKELEIKNLHSSNQVLIVKVILENGHVVTKKIIFN